MPEKCAQGGRDDLTYWIPHVHRVLTRHDLDPGDGITKAETVWHTFPTFLAGKAVVKLFGRCAPKWCEWWSECHETELAMHRVFLTHPDIPAPALLGHGQIFESPEQPWPYLVTARLPGVPKDRAGLDSSGNTRLAFELGQALRQVHDLPVPDVPVFQQDWMAEFRTTCVERHRGWGTLPNHMVSQIEHYLYEPLPDRRLVHGDLGDDHIFVTPDGQLAGIIDWGDVVPVDPYYELVKLQQRVFHADKPLLRAFLNGYRWHIPADFAHRAMSLALMHEFNFLPWPGVTNLDGYATLDQLAADLWNID